MTGWRGVGRDPRELLPQFPLGAILTDRAYARWSPNRKKILYKQNEATYNPKEVSFHMDTTTSSTNWLPGDRRS